MVNVYSGDARNSGALDPNIRGIQGPGRVPLTIDGTEQALTVWRGYMGANNRNYIDPSLIGGMQVIKGPAMLRGANTPRWAARCRSRRWTSTTSWKARASAAS